MPDAGGNIKGISLSGKAGDTLEKIRQRERLKHLREEREANPAIGITAVACGCGVQPGHHPLYCPLEEACHKLIRSGRNPIYCDLPKGHENGCASYKRSSCVMR